MYERTKTFLVNLPADLDRYQTPPQLYRPDTSKPFVSDYMRWNAIIEEIRIVQNAPVPEATWQAFLDKHYNTHIITLLLLFQGH